MGGGGRGYQPQHSEEFLKERAQKRKEVDLKQGGSIWAHSESPSRSPSRDRGGKKGGGDDDDDDVDEFGREKKGGSDLAKTMRGSQSPVRDRSPAPASDSDSDSGSSSSEEERRRKKRKKKKA